MARGGIAARVRRSEESLKPSYRLNGVQLGSRVAECFDRMGRWDRGCRLGVLRTRTTTYVWIKWDEDDFVSRYSQGDARYYVDRGLWRITAPSSAGDPLSALALTSKAGDARIDEQPTTEAAPTKERVMQSADDGKPEGKTYGAKQIATRIGTNAKTFRKFLRSSASPVTSVGQGKRYDFHESDIPKLAQAFKKWQDKAAGKLPKTNDSAAHRGPDRQPSRIVEEDDVLELDEEPSEEDLEDLELELEGDDEGDEEAEG